MSKFVQNLKKKSSFIILEKNKKFKIQILEYTFNQNHIMLISSGLNEITIRKIYTKSRKRIFNLSKYENPLK